MAENIPLLNESMNGARLAGVVDYLRHQKRDVYYGFVGPAREEGQPTNKAKELEKLLGRDESAAANELREILGDKTVACTPTSMKTIIETGANYRTLNFPRSLTTRSQPCRSRSESCTLTCLLM